MYWYWCTDSQRKYSLCYFLFCSVAFCVSMHDQTYLSLQMEMLISGPSFHRITECTFNIVWNDFLYCIGLFKKPKEKLSMPNWSDITHLIKIVRKVLLVQTNISPNYMRNGKQHQAYDYVTIKSKIILMKINQIL